MGRLQGKVAVVTGASKGIGAGIARLFGAEGAAVTVNYLSDREGAERVVAAIMSGGGRAIAVGGDVAKAADMKGLFAQTQAAFGPLDVLVNNAGVFAFGSLRSFTEEEFHRQFNINVLGAILATQAAAPHFNAKGASVINIGSAVGQSSPSHCVIYSATKGALDSVTRVLAKELAGRKIRVNAIAPNGVETEGLQQNRIARGAPAPDPAQTPPGGGIPSPDDIARIALFLASNDSAFVTGERIAVSNAR
jgi:3-oxoacyl-[acyl-carrier protein] reductase